MLYHGRFLASQDNNILISGSFNEVLDLDKKTFFNFRFSNDEKVERKYRIKAVSNTLKATFPNQGGEEAIEHSVFLAVVKIDKIFSIYACPSSPED